MLAACVLVFCSAVIVLVFSLSAIGKARDVRAFQDAVSDFRLLPAGWSTAVAGIFLVTEFAVVLLVALGGSAMLTGFALAAVLLMFFSVALVIALRRNARVTCNCFGRADSRISSYDLIRNALLIVCSVVGAWTLFSPREPLSGTEIGILGLMAVCFVILVTNLSDVVKTLRQPFTLH